MDLHLFSEAKVNADLKLLRARAMFMSILFHELEQAVGLYADKEQIEVSEITTPKFDQLSGQFYKLTMVKDLNDELPCIETTFKQDPMIQGNKFAEVWLQLMDDLENMITVLVGVKPSSQAKRLRNELKEICKIVRLPGKR